MAGRRVGYLIITVLLRSNRTQHGAEFKRERSRGIFHSPAQTAGLRSGDSLVAFGPVQHADFQSVAETVVPIVKANVGKPIDVVVVRHDEVAQAHQVQVALTLTPKSWGGAGLLGCILK